MRTICFVNLKGGVAKTATTVNVAAILAKCHQKRVLIIDADSQCNATDFYGGDSAPLNLADLLRYGPPSDGDWGIQALNKNLAPSPGWFVILGADSSVGKTALALQMAMSMARAGEKVGFFSYETSRDGIIDRLLANAASVRLRQSKDKALTDHDFARVSSEGMRAGKIPLTVIESAGYTVDDLRSEILAERYSVVFVDYVQLVPAGKKADRWQVVTEVSMALHSMAQELGVVVIGLSQVTPPETNQKTGTRRGAAQGGPSGEPAADQRRGRDHDDGS